MNGLRREALFKRLLTCSHEMVTELRQLERFEEWSAIEILALRSFQAVPNHASAPTELARDLHCSLSYASKLIRRLREKGLLRDGMFYRSMRSSVLTEDGIARAEEDAAYLEAFASRVFDGFSDDDDRKFVALLGRVFGNLRTTRCV